MTESRHPKPKNRTSSSSRPASSASPTSGAGKGQSAATTKGAGQRAAGAKAPTSQTRPKPEPAATPPVRKRSTNAALDVAGLGKTYGDLVALAPLDLVVTRGETVVLLGHNGSGKTTLLRMLAGLLDPTEGDAMVLGQPAGSLPSRSAISYLADTPTFYDDLSVWEHLEYVARMHGRGLGDDD